MSYQVLARKWRPSSFNEVVGQQHVLQALINALEQQRLHHAYLFSGTRGVGKTSIARLLAKCLNCDVGVSANPCGECQSCQEIEQGRFIDLIEIDAASRTKVEDTREILDNVQYKPTRARYKVYLIDEVHMLSRSSFNALLKTLEEPPEHVKFLFATTETQKLPVTILSRCLQFNLKALSPRQIAGQLTHILQSEQVESDDGAIDLLSRSAKGSMRDALSLTDQAISHGNGVLNQDIVSQMLGTIDVDFSIDLMQLALSGESQSLFDLNDRIAQLAPDYDALLGQMIQSTHFASMTKLVPNSVRLANQPKNIMNLVRFDAELLQLYYSIMIQGRKELEWASDPQSGFEMVLLRLLAFTPQKLMTMSHNESGANTDAIVDSLESEQSSLIELAQTQTDNTAPKKFLTKSTSHQNLPPKGLAQIRQTLAEQTANQTPKKNTELSPKLPVQATSKRIHNQPSVTVVEVAKELVQLPVAEQVIVEEPVIKATIVPVIDNAVDVQQDTQVAEPVQAPIACNNGKKITPALSNDAPSQFTQEELLNMSMAMAHEDDDTDFYVPPQSSPAPDNHFSNTAPLQNPPVLEQSVMSSNNSVDINAFLKAKNSLKIQRVDKDADTPKKPQAVSEQSEQTPTSQLPSRARKSKVVTLDNQIESLPVVNESNLVDLTKDLPTDANLQPPLAVALVDDPALLLAPNSDDPWTILIEELTLGGRLRQLAIHSTFSKAGNKINLLLASEHRHLNAGNAVDALQKKLSLLLKIPVEVVVEIGDDEHQTPYEIAQKLHQHRLELASERIKSDVSVNTFINDFDANLVDASIKYRTIKAIG
jgi:DNA polymerase-3 subunit gamma/tau